MTLEILEQIVYSEEENIVYETADIVQLGEKIDKADIIETNVTKLKEKHKKNNELFKITNLRNEFKSMIGAEDNYTMLDMLTLVKLGLKDYLKSKFNMTDRAVNYLDKEVIIFRQLGTGDVICCNEDYAIEIADLTITTMVHASSFRPAEGVSVEKFTEITKFIHDYARNTKHTMLRLYAVKNIKLKGENEA